MRIQTNVNALNAYRNLTITNRSLSQSLERLSSGFRINRAADDAAGLAISEKMRGQIRALNRAVHNAQDGINLIQTAERAMIEVHNNLQRIRELSVQAANDTLTANDRQEMQKEVDQLLTEIDRIGNTTEFNTKKLLDGSSAALASSDRLETKIFIRNGLRVEDQFGQKKVGGGNYRLEIVANPGTGQIQKTDIFKIKHEGGIVEWTDVEGTHSSPAALQAAMREYEDLNGITINLIEGEEGAALSGQAVYNPEDGRVTLDVTIAEDTTVDELVALVDDLTVKGGLGAVNEVQNVKLENVAGGNFTLSYNGETTSNINHNVTISQVQNRLEAIAGLAGNIEVTGRAGHWNIEFINELAASKVDLLTIDEDGLIGPNANASLTTVLSGSGGQNARMTVDIGDADNGYFTLTIEGYGTTGSIAHNASSADVIVALQAIGISASSDENDGSMAHVTTAFAADYTITLQGSLSNENIQLTADLSGLRNDAVIFDSESGDTESQDQVIMLDVSSLAAGAGYRLRLDPLGPGGDVTTTNLLKESTSDNIRSAIVAAFQGSSSEYEGVMANDVVVTGTVGDVLQIDFTGALARTQINYWAIAPDPAGPPADGSGDVDFTGSIAGGGNALWTLTTHAQATIQSNSATGGTFTVALAGFGESGPINFSNNTAVLQNNIRAVLEGMEATSGIAEGYVIRGTDIAVTDFGGGHYHISFREGLGNLELNPSFDLRNLEYTIDGLLSTQTQAGQSGTNETRSLYISGAGDGTFELTVTDDNDDDHTLEIAWNATADQIRHAIENIVVDLTAISFQNNVNVTGNGTREKPWIIEFINDLGGSSIGINVDLEVTDTDDLQPLEPGGEVTVSQESVTGAGMSEILIFNILDGDHVIGFNPSTYTTELNEVGFQEGLGKIAQLETALYDIDRFWDASGNFFVEDSQTITLIQGDGTKAAFTLFRDDTIQDVVDKIDAAIRNPKTNYYPGTIEAGKGLGQGAYVDDPNARFAYYVEEVGNPGPYGTYDTVEGTIVINSAIAGKYGEIRFIGDEDIIKALSLTTIRESEENRFAVDVYNAHSDKVAAENIIITSNLLVGVVHTNVDVEFDPSANIAVGWQNAITGQQKEEYTHPPNAFYFESQYVTKGEKYQTFIHLADNTLVYHIGANPMQNVGAAIGDMRTRALGVHNVVVTDREAANDAIVRLDAAIDRVSSERSRLGALQNRLDHTILNLAVASENLSAAESRIRDVDMAFQMMEFTKQQILAQAGTAMLAQANMNPQMVLQLLG